VKRVVTKGIKDEFERDIRVWERKLYRDPPGLSAEDGPITKAMPLLLNLYGNTPLTDGSRRTSRASSCRQSS
jgi:hypothetical protein